MNEAMIGLVSALSVVILKGLLDLLIDRLRRKDKLEDDKTGKDSEILAEIRGLKEDLQVVRKEISDVRGEVKEVREEAEEGRITECRVRILRFADDITHGIRHTKDHFDQVMDDSTKYEIYCRNHPEFPNGLTKASVELIKETYSERLKKNDFL